MRRNANAKLEHGKGSHIVLVMGFNSAGCRRCSLSIPTLWLPFGEQRYLSGNVDLTCIWLTRDPSDKHRLLYNGAGQRADGATGLDYYQARYYDPVAGQFISADSQAAGLNRYGYVAGNPETNTDPTGHRLCSSDFSECDGGGHGKVIDPGPGSGSGGSGGSGGDGGGSGGSGSGTGGNGGEHGNHVKHEHPGERSNPIRRTAGWIGVPFADLRWELTGPEKHGGGKGFNRTHFNLRVQSTQGDPWHNYHIYWAGFGGDNCDQPTWEVADDGLRSGDDIAQDGTVGAADRFFTPRIPLPIPDIGTAAFEVSFDMAGLMGAENGAPQLGAEIQLALLGALEIPGAERDGV